MKVIPVTVNKPRNKEAALNQAIYILNQIEVYNRRKENLMNNVKLTQDKIKRLNEVLEEYSRQIEAIDTNSSNWKEILKELRSNFNLTEAEILELRSSLLREKILDLKRKADIQDSDKVSLF